MDDLSSYIPTDRLHALAQGSALPDRTMGAALFADISGFTPLTEALVKDLGPQRGSEEINRYINDVFDGLISELDDYQGSVITFAGDAITCWLDGDDGIRAVACALSMQKAMQRFTSIQTPSGSTISLAVKVAIATGPVRRFLVGDPERQVFDVLAGHTLDRLSEAEHHSTRGEIVVDEETAHQLGTRVQLGDWKDGQASGKKYVQVVGLNVDVPTCSWPPLPETQFNSQQLRPWLLPPVYERLSTGGGEFLGELRPALPMFVHFTGIDYDYDDSAGEKLDTFVRLVDKVLSAYEGSLLAVLMGDKGSHLFIVTGAPFAHEDDAQRAVSAAFEIRDLDPQLVFIEDIRIGVSQGWLFVGSQGGTNRRTYGAMGDEVNLAARLMAAAGQNEVITTSRLRGSLGTSFVGESLGEIKLKGKTQTMHIFRLDGLRKRESGRLQDMQYSLRMVGREAEKALIAENMQKALASRGQIVGITGEPGIGKSRLAYEAVRSSAAQPFDMFSGECESYGTNTNYLVWRNIWLDLFGLDRNAGLDSHLYNLERQFLQINPLLVPRIPLLGAVLNIPFPDNDLTKSFDARLRKASLETLLVDFLRAKSRTGPVLLLLEDCQWLDDLSHDLLGVIGRAIYNLPVFILMTYRPPLMGRIEKLNVEPLEYFTRISLEDFSPLEAEELIRIKLGQMAGALDIVPPALVQEITMRTGGNPFYIEELLNYLRDHNVDLRDAQVVENLELPDSLYSLILSRIDRISESQKVTLKVASVIGRVFRLAWLSGYYPQVGSPEQITANLEFLARADLTLPVPEEAEQTYLFKHIISREVAYESLPYTTRTRMHGLFARFVEDHYPGDQDRYIDLLAFHYDNSDLPEKRCEYLFKAGKFAQSQYANGAAVDYFRRALPLVNENQAIDVHLCLGQVLEIMGKWSDTLANYQMALDIAIRLGNRPKEGQAQAYIGDIMRKQGHYAEALDWLSKARSVFEQIGDQAGIGQVLHYSGTIAASQGNYDLAKELYEKSLDIRLQIGDRKQIANLYSNLGVIAHFKGENEQSVIYHQKALEIRRDIGDQWMIGISLTNLGNVMMDLGKLAEARALQEDALANRRQSGDPWAIANVLNNLGNTVRAIGDFQEALALYRESLQINYQLDDRRAVAYLLEDMGGLAAQSGNCEKAVRLVGAASALRKTIGSPLSAVEQKKLDGLIDPARCLLGEGHQKVFEQGLGLSLGDAVAYALATDLK